MPIWLGSICAGSLAIAFIAWMFLSEKPRSPREPASAPSSTGGRTEPPMEPPTMRNPIVTIVGPSGREREDSGIEYEASVASLAFLADRVDASWERYQKSCAPYSSGETFGRDWFGVWSSALPAATQPLPECTALLAEILSAAAEVRIGMEAIGEEHVDPETRREVRRRHRMDWSGWDRE